MMKVDIHRLEKEKNRCFIEWLYINLYQPHQPSSTLINLYQPFPLILRQKAITNPKSIVIEPIHTKLMPGKIMASSTI